MNRGVSMAENRWLEPLLALAVLAGLCHAFYTLIVFRYLPQPFFYEPGDAWMDWFNTAYWAYDNGTYDSWKTLYPPVSFIFLKMVTIGSCYPSAEGLTSRPCDWLGAVVMNAFIFLNAVLIAKSFWKHDRNTAPYRSFALAFGMPMMAGWERGNLILVCFTCFMLAHGPLLKSTRIKWLMAGLSVNFKVYLISAIAPYVVRRRWRWFEGAIASVVLVYIATWGLLGRGTPMQIYDNIVEFSSTLQAMSFIDLWYATTYKPVISLLNGMTSFPILAILGSSQIAFLSFALPFITIVAQATIVISSLAAWIRPEAVSTTRLVAMATSLALLSAESGGYTQILFIFMVFLERWQGIGPRVAIICCYLLCIPYEIYIDPLNPQLKDGFLGSGPILYSYWITLGPFIRPGLVLLIPFALGCSTLRAVWVDVHNSPSTARMRFLRRPRFRDDANAQANLAAS